MNRRGRRIKVATGVYRDAKGVSIVLKLSGEQFEKRADPALAVEELIRLRQQWRDELIAGSPRLSSKGTFAADVTAYLKTFPMAQHTDKRGKVTLRPSPRRVDADQNLTPWLHHFGTLPRAKLTSMLIRAVMALWAGEGYAASTLRHRRQELLNLFTALNGKAGANPVRDVPRPQSVRDEPRGVPMRICRYILLFMRPSATKLRLSVLLETGLPHAQIMRIQARDFHEKQRTIFVRPRRKGAGVKPVTLPLTRRGTAAIKALIAGDALGTFSTDSMRASFLLACDKARERYALKLKRPLPVPADLHPYDLRHALLTHAYRVTKDLRAVAELALHSDIKMTQRYAEAAVSETARKATTAMDD